MNNEKNTEKFLIDANILIQPFRLFRPTIAPNFWKQLKDNIENGNIIICENVSKEILRGKKEDELKSWLRSLNISPFDPKYDHQTLKAYIELMNCLENCGYYTEVSREEWRNLNRADPWLISIAKAHNLTLITNERGSNPNKKNPINKEPKIPDVAKMMKVKTENFEYMVVNLGMVL